SWSRCQLLGHPCLLRALQRCSCPVPLALSPAACVLCHRTEADPDICGDKLEKFGLCAHYFATLLPQRGSERAGLMGFLPRDIRLAVRRAAELPLTGLLGSSQHCCVCGQSGATILCCEENCGKWFHLPCAKEGGCVNEYITPYRDRPCALVCYASSAPSAETVKNSYSK
uniref:PHF7 protein n=1 Tax=Catharus ustulatus TaxID=91951 RepID=A0A8C3VH27_CATUS